MPAVFKPTLEDLEDRTTPSNASPLQTIEQDLLGIVNAPTDALLGRPLIGNGANGAPGTGAAGGDGGWLIGNGGAGGAGLNVAAAWDGLADFPHYPTNLLADLNALSGLNLVHGTYPAIAATEAQYVEMWAQDVAAMFGYHAAAAAG
jgi:hypothetical protein